tara:strand:- start:18 stop:821 length:804 start_codon:yes stop_codon:yes gene_type:complete
MSNSNIPKHDILKQDFDWTVPVETVPLPSRGTVYDPESRLYKVQTLDIKAMTAHEEDILSSPALIKKGETVNTLIRSCLQDKSIDVNEMLLGDRNALMISIRVTGYGPDYKTSFVCPQCDHVNKEVVDLSSLSINFLELEPTKKGTNSFEFTLPVTKKKVLFKFLTVGDEKEITASREAMSKHFDVEVENNVTANLEKQIVAIDGVTDKNKIKHFVQYMPAFDSRSLRRYIKDNEPGIKMHHNLVCSACSGASTVLVPMSREFFWPT